MPKIVERLGVAYDDVLIIPRDSDIRSRYSGEIDTSTIIARGLPPIKLPIVSANMDTVTEHRMAMTMALHGGLGIIHRFMPAEKQAREVKLVKERVRTMEDNPPTIPETATVSDALNLLSQRERGYVIVYSGSDFNGTFVGIATIKDFSSGEHDAPISKVMTPRDQLITIQQGTSLAQAVALMKKHRIEKIPVVDNSGILLGVYTKKDFEYHQTHPNASLDTQGRLMVGAAIGVKKSDIERAHRQVDAGVDVLVIDIAHGHLRYTADMLNQLKIQEKITIPIIVGNVATADGTLYVYNNDADGVKVGVGPGFVCETRDVAGVGIPQVTAVMDAAEALANKTDSIPIIADGGVRKAGDLSKAIVAGASSIMIGSLLAGTDESPGERETRNGALYKVVRGMASASAFQERQRLGDSTTDEERFTPEGRVTPTPFKGEAKKVLFEFEGGLRSGMSYVGAHTIQEMQQKGQFIMVSAAGAEEQRRPLG